MLICRTCQTIFEDPNTGYDPYCPERDCHSDDVGTLKGANISFTGLPKIIDHLLQRVADLESRLAASEARVATLSSLAAFGL